MHPIARIAPLALLLVLLSACRVEGELAAPACPGPSLGLDGDWFGTMEDEDGTLFTLEWRICGERISRELLSGINGGMTGWLNGDGLATFSGQLADGTELRIVASTDRRHMVVVTDYFEFAVLQRSALRLPVFAFADLDGRWRGRHARVDWNTTWLYDATAECRDGICDSRESGGVTARASFSRLDTVYGAFRGSYTDSFGERGPAGALMSADTLFVGTWTCPFDYRGPEDCTFGALSWR
jgi:hypothetical protein